jgi:hypothetical protein
MEFLEVLNILELQVWVLSQRLPKQGLLIEDSDVDKINSEEINHRKNILA